MSKLLKKVSAALVVAAMMISVAGCGTKTETSKTPENTTAPQPNATGSKIDQIKKAKKIVVGTSADYAPYEFHKLINGKDEIIGFDINIAKEVAKDLGVELKIQDIGFEGLLPALQTDNVDFVIAGMTPDEKRMKEVDFTKIYYTAQQAVMVRTEDKDKYKTIADLKGKKVGAQTTSIQEGIVKEQMVDSTLISLGKIPDLIMELKNKKVDAIVVEVPVAKGYENKHKDIMISKVAVKDETGGSAIAVKKGNKDLVDAFNKTIDRLLSEKKIDQFVAEANEAVEAK